MMEMLYKFTCLLKRKTVIKPYIYKQHVHIRTYLIAVYYVMCM